MIDNYNIRSTPLEDYSLIIKERKITRIDYVGFTFNGIHSSQLNILRVSDGSRYHENLLPNVEDYSIDITGGIGSNYFGGKYKTRDISIDIAFDSVEEPQLRAMRALFGEREVHELYFDECPYKVYHAAISKIPTIKYIAFGDVGTRVYKGEGSIVFTCYDPIGYSKNGNYLNDYDWENIEEWYIASGMLTDNKLRVNNKIYDNYYDSPTNLIYDRDTKIVTTGDKLRIHAYNAGLLPTPFKAYLNWGTPELKITNETTGKKLILNKTTTKADPIYNNDQTFSGAGNQGSVNLLIDTERSLAIEVDSNRNETINDKTWVLNQLVEDGRFFTLQPGLNELTFEGANFVGKDGDNGFIFYHRYL